MRHRIRVVIGTALTTLAGLAHGAEYSFVQISDAGGGVVASDSGPSLSDAGCAGFYAEVVAVSGTGAFTGCVTTPDGVLLEAARSGDTVPVAMTLEGVSLHFGDPVVNEEGSLGFVGVLSSASDDYGVYRYDPVPDAVVKIADENDALVDFVNGPLPSMNDAGRVAFFSEASGGQILSGDGASRTCEVGDDPGCLIPRASRVLGFPSINDVGPPGSPYNIAYSATAGALACVHVTQRVDPVVCSDDPVLPLDSIGQVLLLADDSIVFDGTLDAPGGNAIFRCTSPDGPCEVRVRTDLGPFDVINAGSGNVLGEVAFSAKLVPGGPSTLFDGTDPVANRVVGVGDPLFGSTLTGIGFTRHSLNARGMIAFRYGLADGDFGIAIAVPEQVCREELLAPDADVDGDGVVTLLDSVIVRRLLAGLPVN